MRIPIKATLIGDEGTGKSAFCSIFTSQPFSFLQYKKTIGINFDTRDCKTEHEYKWQLWDVSGAKTFRSISSSYLRNAHVTLIFVDSTRPANSISGLTGFKPIPKDSTCAVIFTKSDHEKAFKFTDDTCQAYVADVQRKLNIPATQFKTTPSYLVTSAKNNTGINEAIETLEVTILEQSHSRTISAVVHPPKQPTTHSLGGLFSGSNKKQEEKHPGQRMITVPPFDGGRSNTLFQPKPQPHRKEKSPKVNITFDNLGV